MSGANRFSFSLPKRFSALVLSLFLGLFWILSPASLAAASAHSSSAPLQAQQRPRVVADILEVSPRVWRQGEDANVSLMLRVTNHSPSFIRTPRLEVDLTKQPLPQSAQWKQWLSGGKLTNIDAAPSSVESLANVQLPSLFAFSQATVKVNLPAKRIQELTQTAGIYGLQSSLRVVALSNISVTAEETRWRINEFLKSDTSANQIPQPPELGVKNEHFSFHPQLPLDTRVHSDGKYVGDTYRANSFTLLPVLPNQKSEVPVTLFTGLGLVPQDLHEAIPAVTAAGRNQALISAAKQADVNLLVDPAALDYLPKLLPAPKDIHNFTGWTVDQIIDPVKNGDDDATDTDKSPSADKGSSAEPQGTEAATAEVNTPEPSPEQSVDTLPRMQVLQVAHSLSQINPENLAFLPWGTPDLSSLMKSKVTAHTFTSQALAQQSEWAQLFQKVQVAAGKNNPQAPLQLVKLNDFSVFSDPLKELPQLLEASGTKRHLFLTNNQVTSQTVGSTGILSGLPTGSAATAVEDADASEALQALVSDPKNAGINPHQLFIASLVSHAINGQSLMLRVPSEPAAILDSKSFLTNLMREQDWVKTQNLHQLLSGSEKNQLQLQTSTNRSENVTQDHLARSYQLISDKLKKLSGVAAILDAPKNLLNPAIDTSILQLRQPAPSESKILEWADSLEPWWQPLGVNPPENVLMIYGESTLPVAVQNPLPWPVTVNLQATTDSPRLQSKKPSKAKISANSGGSIDLKLNGVGSGDIRTEVKLVSATQTQVSPSESLVVRVRADWETRGLFVVGGIAAAVFVFGLVRRIRQGRRTESLNLSNTKQFHNA